MVFIVEYIQHRRACQRKQAERANTIASLPAGYHGPLTKSDLKTLARPIRDLVADVHNGTTTPLSILRTYGKMAVKAHARTNCLTEVMIPSAERWLADAEKGGDAKTAAGEPPRINLKGPLAGIPVSLKDSIVVGGYDTSVGYTSYLQHDKILVQTPDGPLVRLLKDAGAVPYVKTNLPMSLLSFESENDLWGRTTNPHNSAYSPGGSTGGEGALLACGGRIGIGSDVAGSVRVPAHWSGCYSLRCSTGRWPKAGVRTSMPGQEGVPSVFSPMARTLGDLEYFVRSVIGMKPWRYDHTVHRLSWREGPGRDMLAGRSKRGMRVGVLWTDGVVDPSPACRRALEMVVSALRKEGHKVVDVSPGAGVGTPDMYEALKLASQLLNADGCQMFESFRRSGEWNDTGASQMRFLAKLWAPVRWVYYLWVKYVRRDPVWAGLVKDWRPKSAWENWKLVAQREVYRARWHEWWDSMKLDVIVTVPNATPALPHRAMADAMSSCGYTFLFNLLDYTAGIMPVTRVNKKLDQLPADFSLNELNGVAQGAYKYYDAEKMDGLPVGVQVVGGRLEEEKVLAVMQRIEDALGDDKYRLLDPSTL